MALPPGFLEELRSRIPLSGLVGRKVKLARRGREFVGLCPFHHEKTPSFYVVEDKSFFHCFGCGAHGDAMGSSCAQTISISSRRSRSWQAKSGSPSPARPRKNANGRSGKRPCSKRSRPLLPFTRCAFGRPQAVVRAIISGSAVSTP